MDRFWVKVDIRGEDDCWNWKGAKDGYGYGKAYQKKKEYKAHRLAWILLNGGIPDSKQINHHCDNPKCVNPKHLYVGTQKDNMMDCIKRGRHDHDSMHKANQKGEHNPGHKLYATEVIQIRDLYKTGKYYQKDIARLFGVTQQTICAIVTGKLWSRQLI